MSGRADTRAGGFATARGGCTLAAMDDLPIDRTHPPARIVYDDGARRLVLRPWSYADVDALMAGVVASQGALRGFMPWSHAAPTREEEHTLVTRFQSDYFAGREYVMGMFGASGEVLGGIGLHPRVALNRRALEVGYWCHSDHAGRGWTTLAVRVLIALSFARFDCDRLQVMHDEANTPSRRVTEKCGFVYEGTMRNATAEVTAEVREGGYLGTGRHRLYAITPDDLPALAWLPGVRAATTLHDVFGAAHPLG